MQSLANPEHRICQLSDFPASLLKVLLSVDKPPARDEDNRTIGRLADLIDWPLVADDANHHAVGVLVYRRLKELGWTGILHPNVARAWRADALHAKLQYSIQRQGLLTVAQAFTEHGIRHAFMKGFAYREWFYRPAWSRLSSDTDLLIDRTNVEAARQVMKELGFIQASGNINCQQYRPATHWEIEQTESVHYEMAQFVKSYGLKNSPDWLLNPDFVGQNPFTYEDLKTGPVLNCIVDIHWALHLLMANESPLDGLQVIQTQDQRQIPVLSPEWNLFFSSFKLYFEAFDRPRFGFHHLSDLAAMLRVFAHQFDWQFFGMLIQRYGFEAATFYTLSAAERLAGEDIVPPELLSGWRELTQMQPVGPNAASLWPKGRPSLDFGDFIPYVIGKRIPASFLAHDPEPHEDRIGSVA